MLNPKISPLFFIAMLQVAAPVQAADVQIAPVPAAMPTFSIYEYTVDGNSLLPTLKVENAVSYFMGEGKNLQDVESARAALEQAYHTAGYMTVVVSIPEQSVDGGEVMLHVVEAPIDRLKVKGAEYVLPSQIKSRVPELAEGKVPNFNTMQEQLTALNRSTDSKVTPVLRAGREPGTVEVQLDVDDQLPVHGSVEYSNRQTFNTTAQRLSASMRYDNLWQLGHSLGMTVQTAPEKPSDASALAATYVMPVNAGGDTLTMYAVESRSNLLTTASVNNDTQILGNSDIAGVRFSKLLGGGVDYTHTFSAGVDYKNIKQTTSLVGVTGSSTNSPLAYAPLVANYTGNLFDENRSSTLEMTATTGLRGFLGNNDAAFKAKSPRGSLTDPGVGASADFLALRTVFQHTENFNRWTVYGKLDTQLSSGPLVPTEQFTAGGADSVRGYLESERAGDSGARATLELRTPQVNLAGAGSLWRISGLVFFDTAEVLIREAISPQLSSYYLSGTGLGLRFTAPHGVSVEVDAAHALREGQYTKAGSNRIHARSVWAF